MKIDVRVYGNPRPQPRPRAYRRGDHAAVYNPSTGEGWKLLVAAALRDKIPSTPFEGPVSVSARFLMPRPKRLQRKKDFEGEIVHTAKPDGDNLIKAILDVCSQMDVWRDDAQVADTFIQKRYAAKTGRPGLHLIIRSLNEEGGSGE